MKYFYISADENGNESRIRKMISFVVCSLPMMFILLPNTAYLIVFFNSEGVSGITHLIYTIFMIGGIWIGYLIIAIRQEDFRELMDEIKTVVASSKCRHLVINVRKVPLIFVSEELTPTKYIYMRTAILSDKICRIYAILCVSGVTGAFVMPYAKPLYHYFIGKYSFASWYTPYKTM